MPKQKSKKKKKSPKRGSAKSNRDKSPIIEQSNQQEDDLQDYIKAINHLKPINIKTQDLTSVTPVKENSWEDDESVKYKREPSPQKPMKKFQPQKYTKIAQTAAQII